MLNNNNLLNNDDQYFIPYNKPANCFCQGSKMRKMGFCMLFPEENARPKRPCTRGIIARQASRRGRIPFPPRASAPPAKA